MNSQFQNLVVYYFSGTGNARNSAEWIFHEAKQKGLNTRLIKMDRAIRPEIPDFPTGRTLIGFCFPTHGFNAAPAALSYVSKYPKLKDSKVFLLNTRAGMKISKMFTPGISGLALILPAIILMFKGYSIVAMKPVDLPSNWVSIHPGLRKKVIDSMFVHWHKNVVRFANTILAGKKAWRGLYDLPLDLLIAPIAIAYYFFGRYCLSKTFIATDACTSCEKCVKECPVGALKMKGKYPFWTYRCESCMRCMNHCRERAIETAHGIIIPLWYLLWSVVPPLLFVRFIHASEVLEGLGSGWRELIYNIIWMIVFLGFTFIAYRLLHFLMRFRIVNLVVTYTSLTKYRFWRRYKAPEFRPWEK